MKGEDARHVVVAFKKRKAKALIFVVGLVEDAYGHAVLKAIDKCLVVPWRAGLPSRIVMMLAILDHPGAVIKKVDGIRSVYRRVRDGDRNRVVLPARFVYPSLRNKGDGHIFGGMVFPRTRSDFPLVAQKPLIRRQVRAGHK